MTNRPQTAPPPPMASKRKRPADPNSGPRPPTRKTASARASDLVAPTITYQQPGERDQLSSSALVRPHGPSAGTAPADPRKKKVKTEEKQAATAHPPRPDRNIDKVVLGNLCFRTWYPSQYGKELFEDGAPGSKARAMLERLYLFCQNLSLFAKLFLDNKSVFFDVSGFNYFLLVHTPPTPHPPQITGFFSKEKLSWDSNNLACILIFPPWQRKGLGALLMGLSYELSRREGTVGGPEKPISDLGRRGYRRFWAGEVARRIVWGC
ncbi:hypothetical protein CDD80_2469 [Ophiocordyceps camponoti-rufipedis]|uniref:MYST-type HAT domain-containing protein n=1 Tax=Ophiocordyceps camponoti-rufipedis TaxID=2004952 RepID=A0A2C5YB83_9HYPO|nr:hypothetical protein CDD80_2469 [Ophiocordyceps camponoti-rufipedis]